jgi:hypothetical protein
VFRLAIKLSNGKSPSAQQLTTASTCHFSSNPSILGTSNQDNQIEVIVDTFQGCQVSTQSANFGCLYLNTFRVLDREFFLHPSTSHISSSKTTTIKNHQQHQLLAFFVLGHITHKD